MFVGNVRDRGDGFAFEKRRQHVLSVKYIQPIFPHMEGKGKGNSEKSLGRSQALKSAATYQTSIAWIVSMVQNEVMATVN